MLQENDDGEMNLTNWEALSKVRRNKSIHAFRALLLRIYQLCMGTSHYDIKIGFSPYFRKIQQNEQSWIYQLARTDYKVI